MLYHILVSKYVLIPLIVYAILSIPLYIRHFSYVNPEINFTELRNYKVVKINEFSTISFEEVGKLDREYFPLVSMELIDYASMKSVILNNHKGVYRLQLDDTLTSIVTLIKEELQLDNLEELTYVSQKDNSIKVKFIYNEVEVLMVVD